ncbi:MAG TPA: type VI secretion system tube protein Hcp [Pyrinomonadaceae bacterium]|nr:type VI secretion system tube protein Hcp [Pyrinomonadaceae bacterium]
MPIYMKYEGIEGPVTGKYKGWIELGSSQLGNHRSGTASVSEVVVTKSQDSSSSRLFEESLRGTGKKVSIDFVKGNEAPYMGLELEDTVISSYSISGSSGSDKPTESLSLNYAKITYSSKPKASSKEAKDPSWDWATAP